MVAALQEEFRRELEDRDIDDIAVMENVVIVTVVGAGMRHTPGISGRVFGALGAEGLNIIAIAQGSSECSISLIVDKQDADAAVKAIHRLIVNDDYVDAVMVHCAVYRSLVYQFHYHSQGGSS